MQGYDGLPPPSLAILLLQVAGIGLAFSANNVISGNTILRPVAAIADNGLSASEPFTEAAAIFLDSVAGTTDVVNNTFLEANPQVVPQVRPHRLEAPDLERRLSASKYLCCCS